MSYWDMTKAERDDLHKRREAAGIDPDLSEALEYNPEGNRNEDDIAQVLAAHEGERDGEDWVWLVEFNDGERGLYMGGCDYTGWDCRSSLTLMPFDGWEDRVLKHWSRWNDIPPGAVIAELKEKLDRN